MDRKEKNASYDIETRFIIIKKKYSISCREKLTSIKKIELIINAGHRPTNDINSMFKEIENDLA